MIFQCVYLLWKTFSRKLGRVICSDVVFAIGEHFVHIVHMHLNLENNFVHTFSIDVLIDLKGKP